MIQDFAEQIIGMDPMKIEDVWETLFRKTFWGNGRRNCSLRRDERHRYRAFWTLRERRWAS